MTIVEKFVYSLFQSLVVVVYSKERLSYMHKTEKWK